MTAVRASVKIAKTTVICDLRVFVPARIQGKVVETYVTETVYDGLEIGGTLQDQKNIMIPVINSSELVSPI